MITNAYVNKVLFEARRAVSVEALIEGKLQNIGARGEVILAGGTVDSPQILQLSGVGPGQLLQRLGVPVVLDLPGVGENLQDHYMVGMEFRLRPGVVSVNELTRGRRLAFEAAKYMLARKGVLSLPSAHIAIFCKLREGLDQPDIQFHMMPATMDFMVLAKRQTWALEAEPGLTLAPCQLRPESRGHIHIKSNDPSAAPSIQPNYLSASLDRQVAIAGVRWARKIMSQPALASILAHETFPGATLSSDEQLLEFARSSGSTVYHPVGTCQMGVTPEAIVDPSMVARTRDRGIARCGRLDHATARFGEHACRHSDDRREGKRYDPCEQRSARLASA